MLLLVDDSESNRRTLGALLELEGYAIVTAEGLRAARAALAAAPFRGVLVDVNLGTDDGLDLVPDVRRAQPGAVIIAMSGDQLSPERGRLVDGFFLKGTDIELLIGVLATLQPTL